MSLYQSSEEHIQRDLAGFKAEEQPARALALELANILTGPTCGSNALRLAVAASSDPVELATRMKHAAEMFLASQK